MEGDSIQTGFLAVACPKCGGKLRSTPQEIHCGNCDFALWTVMANRRFKTSELERLLVDGSIGPLEGFRSKAGKPFAATIKLTPTLRVEFDFGPSEDAFTTP
jgi:DNA topoisomerase-3